MDKKVDYFEYQNNKEIFEKQLEEFKNMSLKNFDQEKFCIYMQALFLLSYMSTKMKHLESIYLEVLEKVKGAQDFVVKRYGVDIIEGYFDVFEEIEKIILGEKENE